MSRKEGKQSAPALSDESGAIAATAAQQAPSGAVPTSGNLISVAEELGRLLARRLLADSAPRRGYSLIELAFGAVILALLLVLTARLLEW